MSSCCGAVAFAVSRKARRFILECRCGLLAFGRLAELEGFLLSKTLLMTTLAGAETRPREEGTDLAKRAVCDGMWTGSSFEPGVQYTAGEPGNFVQGPRS